MDFSFLPRIALRGLRAGAVLARRAAAFPARRPSRTRQEARDAERLQRALWKRLARP